MKKFAARSVTPPTEYVTGRAETPVAAEQATGAKYRPTRDPFAADRLSRLEKDSVVWDETTRAASEYRNNVQKGREAAEVHENQSQVVDGGIFSDFLGLFQTDAQRARTVRGENSVSGNRIVASRTLDEKGYSEEQKGGFYNYEPTARYLLEDEVDYYSFLLGSANEATADQWYRSLSTAIEKRKTTPKSEWISHNPYMETDYKVALEKGTEQADFDTFGQTDHGLPSYMTDEERDWYACTLGKFGQDEADAYYKTLRPVLNDRKYAKYENSDRFTAENMRHFPTQVDAVGQTVVGVANNIGGAVDAAVGDAWEYLTTGEIDPYSDNNKYQHMGEASIRGVANGIENDVLRTAYQVGTGIAETVATTAIAAFVGTAVGTAVGGVPGAVVGGGGSALAMGAAGITKTITTAVSLTANSARAFSGTTTNALERGLTSDQAVTLGILSAGIEIVTENYSLGKWLDNPSGITANAVANASEEGVANILNTATDIVVAGDKNAIMQSIQDNMANKNMSESEAVASALFDQAEELGLDVVAGLLSGAVLSAPDAVSDAVSQSAVQFALSREISTVLQASGTDTATADKLADSMSRAVVKNKRLNAAEVDLIAKHPVAQALLYEPTNGSAAAKTDVDVAAGDGTEASSAVAVDAENKNTADVGGERYSIAKTSKMDYGMQLKMVERGELNGSNYLYIGTPDGSLQQAGVSSNPFSMSQKDYRKSRRAEGNNAHYSAHNVPYAFFEVLPQRMAEAPLLVDNGNKMTVITTEAMDDTQGNASYVVVGVERDVPIDFTQHTNQVKSVYPWDNFVKNITLAAESGKLVVTNRNKAEQILRTIGITPAEVSRMLNLAKTTISQPVSVVNPQNPILQSTATNEGENDYANVFDGNEGRPAGVGTGGQAGSVRSGAEPSGREGRRIHDLLDRVARSGARFQSTRSLGISRGTDRMTAREVAPSLWDAEMREADRHVYSVTGKHLRFVVGMMEINGTNGVRPIKGVRTDSDIIVRADHPHLTPTKIALHEMFHELVVQYPQLRKRAWQSIRAKFTDQQIAEIADVYRTNLQDVYGDEDAITDEMLADAYAGINAFGTNATIFSDAVQNATDTTLGEGRPAPANAAPRAPPQSRNTADVSGEKMSVDDAGEQKPHSPYGLYMPGTPGVGDSNLANKKITAEMSDAERAEILSNKTIVAPHYNGEADTVIAENAEDLYSREKGLVKKAVQRIYQQFQIGSVLFNPDMDIVVEVSNGTMKESANKQVTDPAQLAKVLPLLEQAVEGAVGIECHDNRYYYDSETRDVAVLLGGYVEGKMFVPVRFDVKNSKNGKHILYIVIAQNKMETEVVKTPQAAVVARHDASRPISNISVHRVIQNVKSENSGLLKYLPNSLLNAEQLEGKHVGVRATEQYATGKNDKKYAQYTREGKNRNASNMLSAYATDRGFSPVYDGDGKVVGYRNADGVFKSADITYDDDGNLIPFSDRFDAQNPDERYSLGDATPAVINEIIDEPIDETEKGVVPQGVDIHVWEAEMNARAEAKKQERLRTISREEFKGSPALEHLGIKVEGTVTSYDNAEYLRQMDASLKELERDVAKTERRLAATTTEKDQARLLEEGRTTLEGILPGVRTRVVQDLAEMYSFKRAMGENAIRQHKRQIADRLDEQMEDLFGGVSIEDYRNMPKLFMNLRTPLRNMRSIFGDQDGLDVYRVLFENAWHNSAEKQRFKTRMFDRVRTFKGANGKAAELTEAERAVAQVQLEGNAVAAEIAKMETRSRVETAAQNMAKGGKGYDVRVEYNLTDAEFAAAKRLAWWIQAWEWIGTQKVDQTRVDNAVKEYSKAYDELYDAINDFLVVHGDEPIGFVKGYAPHFQNDKSRNSLVSIFKSMIKLNEGEVMNLPTSIAGLTSEFKPGYRWNPHMQKRKGEHTEYDIAYGFEQYVDHIADIFYHTDDIMRIRHAVKYFRTEYSAENIDEEISQIKSLRYAGTVEKAVWLQARGVISEDESYDAETVSRKMDEYLEKRFEDGKVQAQFSNLVTWMEDIANTLAGKQTKIDRGDEDFFGRSFLNAGNKIISIFARSNIAGNLSSIFNQLSQVSAILTECGEIHVAHAVWDMIRFNKNHQLHFDSDYLAGKRGVKGLTDTALDKFFDCLYKPLEWMDRFVSCLAVDAQYHRCVAKGMDGVAALRQADRFAADVMGSRIKGEMPQVFVSRSPLKALVTFCQNEVANTLDHYITDLPAQVRQVYRTKGKLAAAGLFARLIIGNLVWAYLMNKLIEQITGGTPAPGDLMGWIESAIKAGYAGGEDGEFSWSDALAEMWFNMSNDIPYVQNLSALLGLGDSTLPYPQVAPVIGEMAEAIESDGILSTNVAAGAFDLATQLLPAGRQIKKTAQGIDMMVRGGSYKGYGDDKRLQYPVDGTWDEWIRAVMFGKSALPETDEYYASGAKSLSPKQTAEYEKLVDSGMSRKEAYDTIRERADSSRDELNALTDGGMSQADAEKVYGVMDELVPEEGKEKVSDRQRYRAIAELDISEDGKMLAFAAYMPESTYRKLEVVTEYTVTPTQWANYYTAADKDGNGSISQLEAGMWLKSMTSLTQKQRAALWQSTNIRWDPKSNPFNKSVSAEVKKALKEAVEEE